MAFNVLVSLHTLEQSFVWQDSIARSLIAVLTLQLLLKMNYFDHQPCSNYLARALTTKPPNVPKMQPQNNRARSVVSTVVIVNPLISMASVLQ